MTLLITNTGGIHMKEKLNGRTMTEKVYLGLSGLFLGSLLVQFLLAGISVFDDPTKWAIHKRFVHIFGYSIPVLMIISSVIGKFFSMVYRELASIFILIFLMYLTANVGWQVGWLGAFHPVSGVLLIAIVSRTFVKMHNNQTVTVDEKSQYRKKIRKDKGLAQRVLFGAIGGFVAGLLMSNIVGIISVIMFDDLIGIKFLPLYVAILSSILVPIWMNKRSSNKKIKGERAENEI